MQKKKKKMMGESQGGKSTEKEQLQGVSARSYVNCTTSSVCVFCFCFVKTEQRLLVKKKTNFR